MALHPVLAARLTAVYLDPRCEGLVRGVSGSRSKAEQIVLWNGYQAKLEWAREHPWLPSWMNPYRGFNTAANPYILVGASPGTSLYDLVGLREGSWHMEQVSKTFGEVGYAEDINWSELPKRLHRTVEQVMAENRLIRTVFSPQFEPWHWQMAWDDWTWTPKQKEWDEMATKDEIKAVVADVVGKEMGAVKARLDGIDETLGDVAASVSDTEGEVEGRNKAGHLALRNMLIRLTKALGFDPADLYK